MIIKLIYHKKIQKLSLRRVISKLTQQQIFSKDYSVHLMKSGHKINAKYD